jgi:hypothetical protein
MMSFQQSAFSDQLNWRQLEADSRSLNADRYFLNLD